MNVVEFPLYIEVEKDPSGAMCMTSPLLPGLVTQADDWETLYKNFVEALVGWMEVNVSQRKENFTYAQSHGKKLNSTCGFVTLMVNADPGFREVPIYKEEIIL